VILLLMLVKNQLILKYIIYFLILLKYFTDVNNYVQYLFDDKNLLLILIVQILILKYLMIIMDLKIKIMIISYLKYITLWYINMSYQKSILEFVLYLDDQDFLNIILILLYEYFVFFILELFYIFFILLIHDELLYE
jgi:hypothetical protein